MTTDNRRAVGPRQIEARAGAKGDSQAGGHALEIEVETRLQLVDACTQIGRFDEADAVLDELAAMDGLGNGHRLVLAQWRERVAFFRGYLEAP